MARVPLIDDDPAVLGTVETMLADLGYDVRTAENGDIGLRAFRLAG